MLLKDRPKVGGGYGTSFSVETGKKQELLIPKVNPPLLRDPFP
jgi:hypothetical protein